MAEERTVREIGGEVWGEIELARRHAERENSDTFSVFDWNTSSLAVDIVMGVLARHSGKLLMNDADLPVEPLAINDEIANR